MSPTCHSWRDSSKSLALRWAATPPRAAAAAHRTRARARVLKFQVQISFLQNWKFRKHYYYASTFEGVSTCRPGASFRTVPLSDFAYAEGNNAWSQFGFIPKNETRA